MHRYNNEDDGLKHWINGEYITETQAQAKGWRKVFGVWVIPGRMNAGSALGDVWGD